jgi:hypothetical protein
MEPHAAGLGPAGLLGPPTKGTSASCAAVHLPIYLALPLVTEAERPRREWAALNLGFPPQLLSLHDQA